MAIFGHGNKGSSSSVAQRHGIGNNGTFFIPTYLSKDARFLKVFGYATK